MDFGLSQFTSKINSKEVYYLWSERDLLYVSPEARKITNLLKENNTKNLDEKYWVNVDWNKVDVFALGVSIYSSIFFVSPFKEGSSSKNDSYYKYVFRNNPSKFWSSNK